MLRTFFALLAATAISIPTLASADAGPFGCEVADPGPLGEEEARTAAALTCDELAKQHAPPAPYTLRVGRLGTKLRVVLSNGTELRDAWISGAEELPNALPRLTQALLTATTVASTERVDNVLAPDAAPLKIKSGHLAPSLGMFAMTGAGVSTGVSGGFSLALSYRADRFEIFAEGRAGGIGTSNTKLAGGGFGLGGHIYLTQTDFAPLVGGGLEVSTYGTRGEKSGSGVGAFGEVGFAAFRTNKVTFMATVRAAAPFYTLERHDTYAVPLTLNTSLTFL